jgi:hypothetical protein
MAAEGETGAPPRATSAGTAPAGERLLTPAAVAAFFITRVDNVLAWIAQGRLPTVETPRGPRIPESAVREFARQAYRRENHNGIDHGLHSRRNEATQTVFLPLPISEEPGQAVEDARWPFPPPLDGPTH